MTAFLPGLLLGFVGSMPLAGPISILIFGRGLRGFFRSGLAIAAGAAVAEAGYAALACWGFGTLLDELPRAAAVAQALGAVTLVAVGGWFVFHRPKPRTDDGADEGAKDRGVRRGLGLGFTLSALNPTLLATWSATAAMVHGTGVVARGPGAAGIFGLGVGVGIFAWFRVMLGILRRHHGRFRQDVVDRIVQGIGAVLVGLGLWVAIRLVS